MNPALPARINQLWRYAAVALSCVVACATAVAGDTVRVCYEHKDGQPWYSISGKGLNFDLLNQVAAELKLSFRYQSLPWKRCLAKLQANEVDGAFAVSFSQDRLVAGVFPGGAAPDPNKRLHSGRYFLVRKKGKQIDWDGTSFKHVDGVIGFPLGYSIGEFLRAQGVPLEEVNQRSTELLRLVSTGRIGGAAVFDTEMDAMRSAPFAADLEVLPLPLVEKPYFLMLSHAFVGRDPKLAQQIWDQIERARNSAAYNKLYRVAGAMPDK